jgi:hypothetical protein
MNPLSGTVDCWGTPLGCRIQSAALWVGKERIPMEEQEAYLRAKKRVEVKIGFFIHLVVYLGVNTLLIIINIMTSTQYLWFKWPLIGWGIGIIFHALGVFVFSKGLSIKERMIEKEMKKEITRDR